MLGNAPDDLSTPTSTGDILKTDNENIIRLINVLNDNPMSIKDIMNAIGLKDRENFMQYSLRPAIQEGFVCRLYPDKPNHPRQKYMLTVKGLAIRQNK